MYGTSNHAGPNSYSSSGGSSSSGGHNTQYPSGFGGYHQPAAAAVHSGGGGMSAGLQKHLQKQPHGGDTALMQARQQQQQTPPSQPPGLQRSSTYQRQSCEVCGYQKGHPGKCFYAHPELAPADWRPSPKAPYGAIMLYHSVCKARGWTPREPSTGSSAAGPRTVRTAGGLWEGEPVPFTPEEGSSSGKHVSWLVSGGLVDVPPLLGDLPDYALSASFQPEAQPEPAAMYTRSRKQPHSFMPQDNTQPRVRP